MLSSSHFQVFLLYSLTKRKTSYAYILCHKISISNEEINWQYPAPTSFVSGNASYNWILVTQLFVLIEQQAKYCFLSRICTWLYQCIIINNVHLNFIMILVNQYSHWMGYILDLLFYCNIQFIILIRCSFCIILCRI